MKGDSIFTYEGDRTREDLVNFALRLMGPSVTQLENKVDFEMAKKRSELFFLFAGENEGTEWVYYTKIATKLQQHEFFYYADAKTAEMFSGVKETQSIRVYKDETSFKFDEETEQIERTQRDLDENGKEIVVSNPKNFTASLQHWILRERFPMFVKVTRGRFSHLMSTKKLLVMAVLEENKLGEITPDMDNFRTMIHMVMETHLDRYRPHFQFGWTGSPDIANSVAMDTLSVRSLSF